MTFKEIKKKYRLDINKNIYRLFKHTDYSCSFRENSNYTLDIRSFDGYWYRIIDPTLEDIDLVVFNKYFKKEDRNKKLTELLK